MSVKVVSVQASETIHSKTSGDLKKQEMTLVDCTAACRAVVWESAAGTVMEGQTYKFVNVTIRSFNGAKFISLSPQSSIVEVERWWMTMLRKGEVESGEGRNCWSFELQLIHELHGMHGKGGGGYWNNWDMH